MQVWDTSSFITAWRVHYRPTTFATLWQRLAEALADGRIVGPREVYNELCSKDDALAAWAKENRESFRDPSPDVQREAGTIQATYFSAETVRDAADPFVIAEARVNSLVVVTYEGVNVITGDPTARHERKMPGVCQRLGIPCLIVPAALEQLGVTL